MRMKARDPVGRAQMERSDPVSREIKQCPLQHGGYCKTKPNSAATGAAQTPLNLNRKGKTISWI